MTFVSNEPLLGIGLVAKKLGDSAEKIAVAIAKCINTSQTDKFNHMYVVIENNEKN